MLKDRIERLERRIILRVLKRTDYNATKAASILGITRPTLRDRCNKLGIDPVLKLRKEARNVG